MGKPTFTLPLLIALAACPRAPGTATGGSSVQDARASAATSSSPAHDAATMARARSRVWAEVRSMPMEMTSPGQYVEHGGTLFGLDRSGTLVGLDPNTGQVRSRISLPDRAGMTFGKLWLDGDTLVIAYDRYPVARFVRVNLTTGAAEPALDCTYDVKPLASVPGGAVATRFEGALFHGNTLAIAFSTRHSTKTSLRSRLALVDVASHVPRTIIPLEAAGVFHLTHVGDTAYLDTNDEVLAVSLTAARVLWRHQGREFLRGFAATPKAVYVEDDAHLFVLDPQSGKVRASRAVPTQGNDGPVVASDYVVVPSLGLSRFDASLAPAGHVALDAWLIDHAIAGPYAFATSHERLFAIDAQRFELVAEFELDDDGWYVEPPWPLADGFVALTERRTPAERRLHWYAEVGAEALDLSKLPPDAQLFENGRRLVQRPLVLAVGAHPLDLQRPGFDPVAVDLNVVAGATPTLTAPDGPATVEPDPTPDDPLPSSMEIADLLSRSRQRLTLGRANAGSARHGRDLLLLDREHGLEARDAMTQAVRWQQPLPAVLEALGRGAAAADRGRVRARLGAVLPGVGLAVLASDGLPANVLAAFDLATGAPRWTVPMGPSTILLDDPDDVSEYAGQVWYADGEVLYARSARDGHLTRRIHVGIHDDAIANPVFDHGRVFFVYDEDLVCLRLIDEHVEWRLHVVRDARLLRGPLDDLLILGAHDVTRVSREGKVLARHMGMKAAIHHSEPLVTPDAIYVCGGTRIYALEPKSLALLWNHGDHSGHSPCPVAASAHQLLATDGDSAWILDKKSGKAASQPALGALGSIDDIAVSGGEICLFGDSVSECMR